MTIDLTTRAGKGSPISAEEYDAGQTAIEAAINSLAEASQGTLLGRSAGAGTGATSFLNDVAIRNIIGEYTASARGLAPASETNDHSQILWDDGWGPPESEAGGTVSTSGAPVDDDFAKFTSATVIEGRSASEMRTDLGLVIGTNVQAWDADLDALAALTTPATTLASALQPSDIAGGTITAAPGAVDLSGGSDGDVLTKQADGSLALEAASGGLPVDDTTALVQDPSDNTKLVRIDAGSITTGNTRVLTMADEDVDLGSAFADATHTHGVDDITGVATGRLLGRTTASTGVAEPIDIGALTEVTSPAASDEFLLNLAAGGLRRVQFSNVSGSAAAPTVTTLTTTTHPLTDANRKHNNVVLVATSATDIEVPDDATAGDQWEGFVLTDSAVTVSVEGDVGSINGSAGATKTLGGDGSYFKITVTSNAGSAPVVQLEGNVVETLTLLADLDCDGNEITNSVQPLADDEETASFTFALTHGQQKMVRANHATVAITATVPPNSTVAFPLGTLLTLFQGGAAAVTIAAGAGVTINQAATKTLVIAEQYGVVSLWKEATDTWLLFGALTDA